MATPPDRIRVLAADDSVTIREILARLINSQTDMELVGSAASGHEAVRRAAELQPDIILMDIHMPDLDGIQATWLVASRAPRGAVVMLTSEERIDFLQKAMLAGAQGYVLKPFGAGVKLLETVRDVHGRSIARLQQVVRGGPPKTVGLPRIGKRIVVLGSRGGVGTTTIAVNLALYLHQQKHDSVALVDADFLGGDAALSLDVTPKRTVLDLVPHLGSLDASMIDQVMVKHRDGLPLLAAPVHPEQAEVLLAEHVRALLGSMVQMYDHLVIDTALTYDDRMLAVLDLADLYVFVVTPYLGALRSAHHFLEIANTLGYPADRLCFVLNRASNLAGLSLEDITRFLGTTSVVQIPSAAHEVTQAANEGRPVVIHQPRSPVSRALQRLGERVRTQVAAASLQP